MAITKKKKYIGIPLFAVAAALVTALLLWFVLQEQDSPNEMELVQKADATGGPGTTTYIILNSPDRDAERPQPLPLYCFTPPEGFVQIENAEESANRFSANYYDSYENENKVILSLFQQFANVGWSYTGDGEFREVQFGETKVICRMDEDNAAALWLHDQTVFVLSIQQPMNENQLLELVSRVDYGNQREPIYSPWEFYWGSYTEVVINDTIQTREEGYKIEGNPQLPEKVLYYGLGDAPQGFTLDRRRTELNSQNGIRKEFYTSEDAEIEVYSTVTPQPVFMEIEGEDLNNHDLIQEITVGDWEGWYYQRENGAELVFLTDYLIVNITYTGTTTQEEMIALAESLVQKEIQTESEASASS